ncbi:MAG: MFS transporter [Actinobacteria bacterium]|nr:MAG: MFS transporter [Actinomycetota bacterium]TMM34119.1 MAG: MFS transporter [Actinomycetota bacterium]
MTAAILTINRRAFASLRMHRNYRLYFLGQAVSQSGTWIDKVAQAWLVLALTHSAFAVGVLAACQFVPFSVLGLMAGVIVDRLDTWRTVIVTQAIRMVIAATLAGVVLAGVVQVWMVYTLAVLTGIVLVLDAPSRQQLTFKMVGRGELPNAVALNSSLFNAARIVGPGIGGLLIAAFGVGPAFAINAASFVAVLGGLLLMDTSKLVAFAPREHLPTLFASLREGISYARESPHVRLVLTMLVAISTIAMNFNVLLPVLAGRTLDSGPGVFGLIAACFGAGALVGGLLSAALSRASWKAIVAGAGGLGLTELVLAPQHSLGPAVVLLFIAGVCFTLYTANSNAVLQLRAPDHLRGRVIGFYYFAFNGLAPLGGILTGWLAATGGTELAFAVAGAVTAVVAIAAVPQLPHIRAETKPA